MDSENSFREDSPEGRFILELERRIDQSVQILEVAPYNVVEVPPERTWGTSRTCGILLDGPGEKVERMYLSGVSINEMAIQSIGKLTALKEMGFFRCKLPEYQNFLILCIY